MNSNRRNGTPQRTKVPKDGMGPHGAPECYYTSRVLNSTFRYVHFVKKLRTLEEDLRRGFAAKMKESNDKQILDFFARCDRRALINNVASRVDLCMASYEIDLNKKRNRLVDLLTAEDEMNVRKFVEDAQAGAAAVWQDKQDRLAYLLAKRQKEHAEKYTDVPLSKCPHLYRCILQKQTKENQEMQLYQIREKQMRKMAEAEMEKMWHDVAMKESDALAARMELEAMESARREAECRQYTNYQLEMRRQQRDREREQLKLESMKAKAMVENNAMLDAEEERKRQEKSRELGREKTETRKERLETLARRQAENARIEATWDSLATQSFEKDRAADEQKKQKERDLDVCNQKLLEMKHCAAAVGADEEQLVLQEGQRVRDAQDLKRCLYQKRSKQMKMADAAHSLQRINDKKKEMQEQQKEKEEILNYQHNLSKQLDELVKHKELTDAQAKKLYNNDLLEQMAYSNLLKERAKQEQLDQMKKCKIVTEEFEHELRHMLARPYYSDELHPFMRRMASGLRLQEKCICSPEDYCAEPPKPAPPLKQT